tara:strand:- start:428 stop:589 length:162 start_codon:yes stop_codon:yes gene_type:complete
MKLNFNLFIARKLKKIAKKIITCPNCIRPAPSLKYKTDKERPNKNNTELKIFK